MRSRKVFFIVVLTLMMSIFAVPAIASEKMNFSVNGESAGMFNVYGENGISMIPVDAFVRIAGADLNWDSDTSFNVNENGKILALVVGRKEGSLNGETITLPAEPVSVAGGVYVPLRYMGETFGFDVTWDEQQRRVLVNREETRDGLTALDVVVKSGAATQDINTYSMEGNMNIIMSIETGGAKITETPVNMDMQLKGQIQNEPIQMYMQQLITGDEGSGIPETTVETYMTAEKMYIKMPEQGWIVQDMPFDPEFLQQQQDIQSNPIQAAQQMKEMGMFFNFGNDVTIGEQDYYVVNATLDMEKFSKELPQMMQQVLHGVSGPGGDQNSERAQAMQKIVESMEFNYYYSVLINKDTFITDVIKLDSQIKMEMGVPQTGEPAENGSGEQQGPKEFKLHMKMSGEISVTDPGMPFNAPDVSGAKEMTELK